MTATTVPSGQREQQREQLSPDMPVAAPGHVPGPREPADPSTDRVDRCPVSFTPATVAVGQLLLEEPETEHWAYRAARDLDREPATVCVILQRMCDVGWLTVRHENRSGRSTRHVYRLTGEGRVALRRGLNAAEGKAPPLAGARGPRPRQPRLSTVPRQVGICPHCVTDFVLRTDGLLPGHGPEGQKRGPRCDGSWTDPIDSRNPSRNLSRNDKRSDSRDDDRGDGGIHGGVDGGGDGGGDGVYDDLTEVVSSLATGADGRGGAHVGRGPTGGRASRPVADGPGLAPPTPDGTTATSHPLPGKDGLT